MSDTRTDWLPDEVASAGRENLDPNHAARYDTKEDAEAQAEVALLRDRGLEPDSVVVEFGPGTGQLTTAVAPHCARVVAVDPSAPMRDRLAAKVETLGLSNVDLIEGGFLTYRHEGVPVDVVYSRYALHHLPDAWKVVALQRIRKMLRPGGLFRLWDVVYDFEPYETTRRFEQFCAAGGNGVDGEWSRAELAEHLRDEHSTFVWLLEPMLTRCGFVIETRQRLFEGFASSYVLRAADDSLLAS